MRGRMNYYEICFLELSPVVINEIIVVIAFTSINYPHFVCLLLCSGPRDANSSGVLGRCTHGQENRECHSSQQVGENVSLITVFTYTLTLLTVLYTSLINFVLHIFYLTLIM